MAKRKPKKTVIHVNKHVIAANNKHDRCDPPITVKTYNTSERCQSVAILDEAGNEIAEVLHSLGVGKKPLSCGARVWISTKYGVRIKEP